MHFGPFGGDALLLFKKFLFLDGLLFLDAFFCFIKNGIMLGLEWQRIINNVF